MTITDLIGPARKIGGVLVNKCHGARMAGAGVIRLLFIGPPGTGKSTLATILAADLTDSTVAQILANKAPCVELVNGANVSADTVRNWQQTFQEQTLFGDWRVIIIDEIDKMSAQAKALMLTFLDTLPAKRAVIATSNIDLNENLDAKRTQGRFQLFRVAPPSVEEIVSLIMKRFSIPSDKASALVTQTDVRAVLLDAESYNDCAMV